MADYEELDSMQKFDIFDGTFESIKNNLFMRLFNKHNLPLNKELESVPHINYADLTMTFSIEERAYFDGRRGVYSYMITNDDMKLLNVTKETLKEIAMKNLTDNNSVKIETINQHIFRSNVFSPLTRLPNDSIVTVQIKGPEAESFPSSIFNTNPFGPIPIMNDSKKDTKDVLLISNRTQTFASVNFVMPNVLNEVYNKFNENFYIVPSSVHELICIKSSYATNNGEKTEKETIEELEDMVEQINDVLHEDTSNILSYNIYYHIHDDNCTMIVT